MKDKRCYNRPLVGRWEGGVGRGVGCPIRCEKCKTALDNPYGVASIKR